jgi:hypothetical protein
MTVHGILLSLPSNHFKGLISKLSFQNYECKAIGLERFKFSGNLFHEITKSEFLLIVGRKYGIA